MFSRKTKMKKELGASFGKVKSEFFDFESDGFDKQGKEVRSKK
jgi:hypothetical protein